MKCYLIGLLLIWQYVLVRGAPAGNVVVYPPDPPPTFYVYIGIECEHNGKKQVEDIKIALYGTVVPDTVKNFVHLARGVKAQIGDEKPEKIVDVTYKGKDFGIIRKGYLIQGGVVLPDIGRFSIYGNTFPDENFDLKVDRPGRVAMANSGEPNTNSSPFFIVTKTDPKPDEYITSYNDKPGTHSVVFGQVVEGLDFLINVVQNVEVKDKKPTKPVIMKYLLVDEVVRSDTDAAHRKYLEALEKFKKDDQAAVGVTQESLLAKKKDRTKTSSVSSQKSSNAIDNLLKEMDFKSPKLWAVGAFVLLCILIKKRRNIFSRSTAKVISVRSE